MTFRQNSTWYFSISVPQRWLDGHSWPLPAVHEACWPESLNRFLGIGRDLTHSVYAPDSAISCEVNSSLGIKRWFSWIYTCYHCPHAVICIQLLKWAALHVIQLLMKPNTSDLLSKFSFVCFEKYSFVSCVIATFYFDGSEIHWKTLKWLVCIKIFPRLCQSNLDLFFIYLLSSRNFCSWLLQLSYFTKKNFFFI